MLAPKAAKSDIKQINSDRVPNGSSSDVSEDDTPLAVRLHTQGTSRPNDTGKPRIRPFLSKKGASFVIPRKKKQTNELLQVSNFNSRDGKELLRNVEQSYRDPALGATFKFGKLELVHNDKLSTEYQEKKQSMRNEWRNARELEDKFAFLYTLERNEAKRICEMGLEVGSSSLSCLGDPSMGVYLCRHADVISRKPLPPAALGYLIIFKVIKGKVKPVTERTAGTDLLEPTPNFDCHISRSIQNLPANTPLSQLFDYSQYYFYEFAEEGDDLHVKRPRQCLPYAVITFSLGDYSTAFQELSIAQDEMPSKENSGLLGTIPSLMRPNTRIVDNRQGRTSHVLWTGKISNKDRILANAQLVCHSLQKTKLPFDIGERIVMREKISFDQLRPFLTFPLFRAGPPVETKICKASVAGDKSFFLHCDLLPVEDDHGKIKKLVKFFQERNWAGIVKSPDANRVIFLIPTSQVTLDLGITTVDSPAALHVLLFVNTQKKSKDPLVRENSSREVKTVSQIQDELKRCFSDIREIPAEQKRLSLDSVIPQNKPSQDSKGPEFVKELTNEQTASWKSAVENWLSRPHPLHHPAPVGTAKTADKLPSPLVSIPKTTEQQAEMSQNKSIQGVQICQTGGAEQQRAFATTQADDGILRQLKGDNRVREQNTRPPIVPLATKKVEHGEDRTGSAEPQRAFARTQADDGILRQLKGDNGAPDQNTRPPLVPLVTKKVEHREDWTGSAEQQRAFARTQADDGVLRQLKGDSSVGEQNTRPPIVPLATKKVEHREDWTGSAEQQRAFAGTQADDGVLRQLKGDSSVGGCDTRPLVPLVTKKVEHREDPRLKRHSVDGKPSPELESPNAVTGNDSMPYNAQNALMAQGVISSSVSTSTSSLTNQKVKFQVNDESVRSLLGKLQLPKHKDLAYQVSVDDGTRKALEILKQKEESKTVTTDDVTKNKGKLVIAVRKNDRKSPKKGNSSVTKDKEKLSVKERVALLQSKEHKETRKEKRQEPLERSGKKKARISKGLEKNDGPVEKPEKAVVQNPIPELSDDSFPAISSKSLEMLKGPPSNAGLTSKATKLKLILKPRNKNEPSAGQGINNSKSSEQNPTEVIDETKLDNKDLADLGEEKRDGRSLESPVAMDLSPLSPACISGSVSPITVVSSKGRYNPVASSKASPTTPVNSTPASSSFPFSPPVPQGPFRSPVSPVGFHGQSVSITPSSGSAPPIPGINPTSSTPSSAPVPFVPPVPASPVLTPTSVAPPPAALPVAPPLPPANAPPTTVPHGFCPPAISMPPRIGSLATSVPLGVRPPVDSPLFTVPQPPAFPGNVQRRNSLDSLPTNVSSSPGMFPPTLPGLQWTPHAQGLPFPHPRQPAVNIPPAALPRPSHPLTMVRPPVFLQQLGPSPQVNPLPVQHLNTSQQFRFPPVEALRFGVPPATLQGLSFMRPPSLPNMVPLPPQLGGISGAPMAPVLQQMSFQQRPAGFWLAPMKTPAASDANLGRMPLHHNSVQKHANGSVPSSSHKSSSPVKQHSRSDDVAKGERDAEKAEKSVDQKKNSDEICLKEQNFVNKSSLGVYEVTEHVLNTSDISDECVSESEKLKTVSATEEKTSEEDALGTDAEKELSADHFEQPRDKNEIKDFNNLQVDETQTHEEKPLEPMLTSDALSSKSEQKLPVIDGGEEVKCAKMKDQDDFVSRKSISEALQPNNSYRESQTSSFTSMVVSTECSSNESSNVLETQNIDQLVEGSISFPTSLVTNYVTEAEQASIKAVNKIYDILRRNASEPQPEASISNQEPENPCNQDEPDKPDIPEPAVHIDEGMAKEEKLLFSGEESATSEQTTHLESGLRIVQLLDLGGSESEKEKETSGGRSSSLAPSEQGGAGTQGEISAESSEESRKNSGSHLKRVTGFSKKTRWDNVSNISDDGTSERDLPGYGTVNINSKQHCPKTTTEATQNTYPDTTAAPKEPKPKTVRDEGDSVTPVGKSLVSVVTQPSQKRRRHNSTTEGSDSEERTTPSKRRRPDSHMRRRHRQSPERYSPVDSTKKSSRDRSRSNERCGRSKRDQSRGRKVSSRIVVSNQTTKGQTLKITILQDPSPEKGKVEQEKSDLPKTPEERQPSQQKNPLADIEYSDLEDISPGRLSSENERPATPDTPETAIPAIDFTHPSLGFWAAPLGNNEMAKPAVPAAGVPMIAEDPQATGADDLPPITNLSYLDDQLHSGIQLDQVSYGLEGRSIREDAIQAPWPTLVEEGFFCQTTTSEERDLLEKDVDEKAYLTGDRYFSMPSHESGEKSRYDHEFAQPEVFDYERGHSDKQFTLQRSSGHTDSRGTHKDYKHHSSTRTSRYYPWQTHVEDKRNQMTSTGGEGSKSTEQNVTGKSTGSEMSAALAVENPVKKFKLDKGILSTKHDNSGTTKVPNHNDLPESDKPRKWDIMVFARMDKSQFSNWLRRKQHGAKLSLGAKGVKNPVQYTAETYRRSSERLLRRVKRQLRPSSRSRSKSPHEERQLSDCPDFDFDDLGPESNLLKEDADCSVSKESTPHITKDATEKCNVHSHSLSSPCTVNTQVVHRSLSVNDDKADKETHHIDLLCDNEGPVLLERAGKKELGEGSKGTISTKAEQLSSEQLNQCRPIDLERTLAANDGAASKADHTDVICESEVLSTSEWSRNDESDTCRNFDEAANTKSEQPSNDPSSECEAMDVERNLTSDVAVGVGKESDDVDLICDNEVSVILERCGKDETLSPKDLEAAVTKQEKSSNDRSAGCEEMNAEETRSSDAAVGKDDHIDPVCNSKVSAAMEVGAEVELLTSRTLDEASRDATDTRLEQLENDLLAVERTLTGDATVGSICKQESVTECFKTLLDPVMDKSQPCARLDFQNERDTGSGRINEQKVFNGEQDEGCSDAYSKVLKAKKLQDDFGEKPHDQDLKQTKLEAIVAARGEEGSSMLGDQGTLTTEVKETAQSSCKGVVVAGEGSLNTADDKELSLTEVPGDKEVAEESSSCRPPLPSSSPPLPLPLPPQPSPSVCSMSDESVETALVCQTNTQPHVTVEETNNIRSTRLEDTDALVATPASISQSPFVVTSVFSCEKLSQYLSPVGGASSRDLVAKDSWLQSTSLNTTTASPPALFTPHYPIISTPPPLPSSFMWPRMGQPGSFPIAGVVPTHASLQQPNYRFPSWADQAAPVPFPVGRVQQPSAGSGDICPPGTEDEQNVNKASGPAGIVADDDKSQGNFMDHSLVSELMQFYSEINEVEEKDSNNNQLIEKTVESVKHPEPVEPRSDKDDGATSEMEIGSDLEGSVVDVSENTDVQETAVSENAVPETAECFDESVEFGQKRRELVSTSNKYSTVTEGISKSVAHVENTAVCSTVASLMDKAVTKTLCLSTVSSEPVKTTAVSSLVLSTVDSGLLDDDKTLKTPAMSAETMHVQDVHVSSPLDSPIDTPPLQSPAVSTDEVSGDIQVSTPVDPIFFANVEKTIFSSISDLTNLLGQSPVFDRIAEDAIASTVSSLEDVLLQAQSSYQGSNSCPSDSGVSIGEEYSMPLALYRGMSVPASPLQGSSDLRSEKSGPSSGPEGSDTSHCTSKVPDKEAMQKKLPKIRKKFQFYVYSPEHDKECEAVKNYMLKAGGVFVDVKDSSCLQETTRELRVLIRKKHLPSVHRLANLYQLKMASSVKFALFNTLTDVLEGSRSYENIFVSGGALLADDTILKTIDIDYLAGLLRYLKEQSLAHQKFVWVLNISRNGYKRLSMNRPLSKRDSKALNILRRYKDEGFITVLPKGYVTEGIPATQRYLQTSLKLQIELMYVYRHIILLSDMDKGRVEVPWFLERGIGVMNVQEFLTTFAGECEAKTLLNKRPHVSCPETSVTYTAMECSTPEDDAPCPTSEGTPMSDSSTDSPIMDTCTIPNQSAEEQPRLGSSHAPQKRTVRSLSWDTGTMTQTRLQILSCVRRERDIIRNQISSSTPSSPVSRSM